jgi:hypothetical protein
VAPELAHRGEPLPVLARSHSSLVGTAAGRDLQRRLPPCPGATKHPKALGASGHEIWPEIWDIIGPVLNAVMAQGAATLQTDQQLFLNRNGYLEETYFTYACSPIRDESGGVGGVFSTVFATTERVDW